MATNLRKLSNARKLQICRLYFFFGLPFLPFVWLVNFFWFFCEAFKAPPYDEQPQVKRYVIMSGVGAVLWLALLITWIGIYQAQRASWGLMGDKISFVIPQGEP